MVKTYVCDFETTVYSGQVTTEVWAFALVEMYTEDVHIFGSIEDGLKYLRKQKCNCICYFHNLKFDGSFLADYFARNPKMQDGIVQWGEKENELVYRKRQSMRSGHYTYSISTTGQWYRIMLKQDKYIIEFRDSLKLLPFSVREIGSAFKTKHQKSTMEYEGIRYSGCEITKEEREYIANDVLVVKEALEVMFDEGHNKLTIGSCCLSEFKEILKMSHKIIFNYDELFPNLYDHKLDENVYGYKNAGEYIRSGYKGGWCYVKKDKKAKHIVSASKKSLTEKDVIVMKKHGITLDVNSLYPSVMHSESGNYYPIGSPRFWSGNEIPEIAQQPGKYFYVRVRTRFSIKKDHLPFIQQKHSLLYSPTECLERSDYWDEQDQKYYRYVNKGGKLIDSIMTMTLSMTDYYLLLDHYHVKDFEILDGCYFEAMQGIFDEYIDKYREIKMNSKGAKRTLAKLFLNNLYGKLSASTNSSFKVPYLNEEKDVISFKLVVEDNKTPGYIAAGAAVTSYARDFTIRAAQQNYEYFCYADTDSIHCTCTLGEIKGVNLDDNAFNCWKCETFWDEAIFTRQKTYIEHVTHEDCKPTKPYYNIKCAGMPDRCKDLLVKSMSGLQLSPEDVDSEERWNFFMNKGGKKITRTVDDFRPGLQVPGKLYPKRMHGGIVLVEGPFEMR